MIRLVDSSVAVKWFVAEEGDIAARAWIGQPLTAPDLLLAEVSNVAIKKWKRGEATIEQARLGPSFVISFVELVPSRQFAERALDIAFELRHPVYDCYFIAMCEMLEARMVTADRRLIALCAESPFADYLEPLAA